MSYSPEGCKESDMNEATEHACVHITLHMEKSG